MKLIDGNTFVWGEKAKNVDAKPGVYIFYDKNGDVIYIGQSENLKERFTTYFATNFENNACKQNTVEYQREFTTNHEEREKQLLEFSKRKFGRLPPCNEKVG